MIYFSTIKRTNQHVPELPNAVVGMSIHTTIKEYLKIVPVLVTNSKDQIEKTYALLDTDGHSTLIKEDFAAQL